MAKKSTKNKKTELVKPKARSRKPELDFNECTDYIEKKYGYSTRGFAFDEEKLLGPTTELEYRDFWHWVVDHYTIHNGCHIEFSQETLDEYKELEPNDPYGMKDWQIKIYQDYLNEFADENGEINFYVWW